MKRSFYPRLAIDGMRKNRRMYGPYLAMGVLMAAICYILSALSRSDALRTLPGGDNLCMIMALGNVVLLIFSVIFLFYTNSFLIRRRRREFGLYNVLGMSKRNLARILTWETLLTAAIAIAGGLFFGMLLSKLIELAIVKMMGGTATLAFPFDLSALHGVRLRGDLHAALARVGGACGTEYRRGPPAQRGRGRKAAAGQLVSQPAGPHPARRGVLSGRVDQKPAGRDHMVLCGGGFGHFRDVPADDHDVGAALPRAAEG